jgi:hypothetical protein
VGLASPSSVEECGKPLPTLPAKDAVYAGGGLDALCRSRLLADRGRRALAGGRGLEVSRTEASMIMELDSKESVV